MRRREFIVLLGGAPAAALNWLHAARAQPGPKLRRIGVLETVSATMNASNFDAFRRGMRELGYVEGQSYVLEYRGDRISLGGGAIRPAAGIDKSGLAQEAARALGVAIHVLEASSPGDFEPAFAALARLQIGALVVGADPYFHSQRERIVALAARHAVPAIYEWREFAESGGLMSYGTNLAESYRLVGLYAGRILKGAKPADLPVMQATTVELVVNLRTAKTLGLTIPTPLLGRADVVIE
jgi:hypothetical protein